MTTEVLAYSLTGNTRRVAGDVAAGLGAQLHEIAAPGPAKPGLWAILRLGFAAIFHRRSQITVPPVDWAGADLLVLATPVWAGRVSVPMRQWLETGPALPARVALVVTSGDPRRPDAVFAEFARLTGRDPVATLHLGEAALKGDSYAHAVGSFVQAICNGDVAADIAAQ